MLIACIIIVDMVHIWSNEGLFVISGVYLLTPTQIIVMHYHTVSKLHLVQLELGTREFQWASIFDMGVEQGF